jgi:orotate phosphoribosyltransferase
MGSTEKGIAELLLKTRAVTLSPGKPYTWTSGIRAPIYTDNRILLSCPEERRKIVSAFTGAIKRECPDFDYVAGVATSGIPWAAWVAEELDKPMVYVRSKRKEHGRENMVEGRLEKGKKAIIVEDLVSTGGSSVTAVEGAREAGVKVTHCFAIFTYEFSKSVENFKSSGCKLVTLTNISTLAELASGTGYISKEENEEVLAFSRDPEEWGKLKR